MYIIMSCENYKLYYLLIPLFSDIWLFSPYLSVYYYNIIY